MENNLIISLICVLGGSYVIILSEMNKKMKKFLLSIVLISIINSCQNSTQKNEKELKTEISEKIILKNLNGMMVSHYQEHTRDMILL